jgi:hypothetical protein
LRRRSIELLRISQSYSRRNRGLVLQAVNFALNAFGDDVFPAIAEGAIKVRDAPGGVA